MGEYLIGRTLTPEGKISIVFLLCKLHQRTMNYFDSDMSKSTNTVVYFDWKTVIYIYVCRQCRT